ncbi:MAG: DUF2075 domain-containing protein [Planctomycetes bacterium]|nr:DUF2075 domain-containing protein [Planctomycetota bacterium]
MPRPPRRPRARPRHGARHSARARRRHHRRAARPPSAAQGHLPPTRRQPARSARLPPRRRLLPDAEHRPSGARALRARRTALHQARPRPHRSRAPGHHRHRPRSRRQERAARRDAHRRARLRQDARRTPTRPRELAQPPRRAASRQHAHRASGLPLRQRPARRRPPGRTRLRRRRREDLRAGHQEVRRHLLRKRASTPPEHLVVFDEAQRAHDAGRVAHVHKADVAQSEPEHLLEFMLRVPEWSVLVALVGTGQAIHVGEEGGIALWRDALAKLAHGNWIVHAPANIEHALAGASLRTRWNPALNLDTELRHHLVPRVHAFVDGLLQDAPPGQLAGIARELRDGGHRFLVTTDLDAAKQYLRERYGEAPRSRYGLLASSKDKLLPDWGVDNTFQTTKRLRAGPWFNQPPSGPLSCCRLDTVATEFVAQGLELDMALLAWGTDFVRENGAWTNRHARGTKGPVHDTLALRRNSYRVLLTRGRDGTVLFVPPVGELAETLAHLERAGVERLA